MSQIKRLLPGLLSLALMGCAIAPPVQHALSLEHAQLAPGWSTPSAGEFDAAVLGFPIDASLNELIAEAIRYNADLRLAAARSEQAQAALKAAAGVMLPSVALGGQLGNSTLPTSSMSTSGIGLVTSWEVDLWGRLSAEQRAARSRLQASTLDLVYARQSLAANVIRSWIALQENAGQLKIARQMLEISQQQLLLIELGQKVGRNTRQEVALHQAGVEAQRQQLLLLEQAQYQARRALEVLLGRYPAGELAADGALPMTADLLPAGIPSELLSRRPDLLASQQRFEAAFYGVEAAKRARLPSLKLTGGVAYIEDSAVLLKSGIDNPLWAVTGQLLAPIFTGGQLAAQVEAQNAKQHEALAAYNKAALNALAEVENGLNGEKQLSARYRGQQTQVQALTLAVQYAAVQKQVGKIDDYQLLQQKQSLAAAQASLLRVQSQRLDNRVALHLALGGQFLP
ncbi:efflux transporter outer membrane subunit [Chromobacterium amazonense]|uniref:Efflux transporter outer membrane subunit n=1 Tax=Chromobacterium amazonense TaxID=1382803 RepID=A0ABU8V643_9NEIS|nr:efflux transporter outer membrane subunit [Chromobacterium amazonense]MDQ4539192.1 efflux transporter outer membrane subunit [Chromobacterium amazonense]